jgi:bifunctional non-homologous end joining protein LigD
MTEINKITLECHEGGSSKQYTLWIGEKDGGFTVDFNYGPIGGWVKPGTKTSKPVTREAAEKAYASLLKEKRAKGYVQGKDAPAYSEVPEAVDSGIRPMLLTPDAEENIPYYVNDDAWAAQEKMNGKRILLKSNIVAVGINKRGLECPIPMELANAMKKWAVIFDGELIGITYHVFDILYIGSDWSTKSQCELPLKDRWESANNLVRAINSPLVRMVPLITGSKEKFALVSKLRDGRKEGTVFKRLDGKYDPGRIENLKKALAVKIKFYAEGQFAILKWNAKMSVEVAAMEGKKIFSVGNVTIAQKYADQIKVGALLRVKYLYATPGAKQLFQAKLDPTDDGIVIKTDSDVTQASELKFEGKEEE